MQIVTPCVYYCCESVAIIGIDKPLIGPSSSADDHRYQRKDGRTIISS